MNINRASTAMAAAFLLSGLWASAALAHPGFGGGGGGLGGGGHSGVSAGHGFAGHAGSSRVATQRFASRGFSGARSFSAVRAPAAHWSGPAAGVSRGFSRGVVASAGFRGRAIGPGFGHGLGWRGGIWGGRFWPGVRFGLGVAWFLPVLPLYYSTFWWDNVPYYYCDDSYYTWSQAADGYVVTDPPPAVASAPADSGAGADINAASAPAPTAAEPQSQGSAPQINDNVYAYPGNGQSEDQQAIDRQQCDQWASSQVGGTTGSPDFRRAVIACFQGRGYSAQ